jgi:hypothetical protein
MKFLLISIALVFALAVYQAEAKNLGMKARFNTWKARFGKRNDDPATEEKRSIHNGNFWKNTFFQRNNLGCNFGAVFKKLKNPF